MSMNTAAICRSFRRPSPCEIDVGSWLELGLIGTDVVQFVGNMA